MIPAEKSMDKYSFNCSVVNEIATLSSARIIAYNAYGSGIAIYGPLRERLSDGRNID